MRSLVVSQILLLLALAPSRAQPQDRPSATPEVRVFPSGGLDAEVAALIMSGQEGGALPLEVLAVPVVDSDGARLDLVVEVAGQSLLADSPPSPLQVELFAYLLTPGNIVRSWLLRSLEIDLESTRSRLEGGGLRLVGSLDVLPGDYSLRVLVRAVHSGALGSRVRPLRVPAPSTDPLRARALLESSSEPTWLDVELTAAAAFSWWTSSPAPPSALPVVAAGQAARVRVAVTGAVASPSGASVEILERPGGEPLIQVPLALDVEASEPTGSDVVLAGELTVPQLASGRYRMRVALFGPAAEPLRSGEIGFLVVASTANDLARGWPGFDSGPSPSPSPSPSASPVREEEAGDRTSAVWSESERTALSSLHRSYEQALDLLAAGDRAQAIGLLSELESDLLRDHGYRSLAMLRQEGAAMARRLVDQRPEGLLPVSLLHASLHGLHQRRGRPVLRDHSRLLAVEMLDQYVAATEPTGGVPASDALTSLAADLLRSQLFGQAEAVLDRALLFDADNETALLGLAAMHEKEGRYAKAVAALRRLLDARPDHPEALLRLGVNELRLGHPVRGRRALTDLIAGDFPAWVTSIAYQELARERKLEGELEEAEQLLRQAVESLSEHGELYVQLAMTLDLQGRPGEAAAVLNELDRVRRPERESARRRYNQWPRSLLETIGRQWDGATKERLADLGAVLKTGGVEPDG